MLMFRRIAQLLAGLFLYGIAIAMMLRGGLGASPWDVLSQGVVLRSGLNFAVVTIAIGALVLLLWIPIRQRPGFGTVANVLLIGPAIEVGLWMLPTPEGLWQQILLLAGGLAMLAVATGLYIGARFGPGPRDGLMTGIHRRTGLPIWAVRTAIEVTVLAIGWLLGGTVGFGTLAFALLIGPMVGVTLPLLRVPGGEAPVSAAAPAVLPLGTTAPSAPAALIAWPSEIQEAGSTSAHPMPKTTGGGGIS